MSVYNRFGLKTFTAMAVLFWTLAPLGKAIGENSQKRPVTEAPSLRDSLKQAASEKSLAQQRPTQSATNSTTLKGDKRKRSPASVSPVRIEPNTGPDAATANTSPEKAAHRQ